MILRMTPLQTEKRVGGWSWIDAGMLRNAWVMWGVVLVVVCVMIGMSKKPITAKSVTGNYRSACVAWWDREPMYRIANAEDIDGFLYFPQAAILHTPFSFGPPKMGEFLWRAAILGVFAAGVWRLAKLANKEGKPEYFAVISFLAVFSVAGNLRNGQSNLMMAGTMMLAAAELGEKNWWRAVFWLVLGLMFKPLGAVMILLAGAVYWREMSWRLLVGILVGAALPFLTAPVDYAWSQHVDFVTKMRAAGAPNRMFADVKGMVETYAGPVVPDKVFMAVRGVMALVTLGLAWWANQRFGARGGALALLAGATVYLMLFNPRTEGLSYVALAPLMGVFLCRAVWEKRNVAVAVWLGVCCVMFGLEFETIKAVKTAFGLIPLPAPLCLSGLRCDSIISPVFGLAGWFKAPMAVLFGGYLVWLGLSGQWNRGRAEGEGVC
jgi:alpha-1,2-mannosyltransferase